MEGDLRQPGPSVPEGGAGSPADDDRLLQALGEPAIQHVFRASLALHQALRLAADSRQAHLINDAVTEMNQLIQEVQRAVFRHTVGGVAPVGPPGLEVVWLDEHGIITATNDAWNDFCLANGGDPASCGVGVSFLEVCERAGDLSSRQVVEAVRIALRGDLLPPRTMLMACHSPSEHRWYDMAVYPRFDLQGFPAGAMVTIWQVGGPDRQMDTTFYTVQSSG